MWTKHNEGGVRLLMADLRQSPDGLFANFPWELLPKCEICERQFWGDLDDMDGICADCWKDRILDES